MLTRTRMLYGVTVGAAGVRGRVTRREIVPFNSVSRANVVWCNYLAGRVMET